MVLLKVNNSNIKCHTNILISGHSISLLLLTYMLHYHGKALTYCEVLFPPKMLFTHFVYSKPCRLNEHVHSNVNEIHTEGLNLRNKWAMVALNHSPEYH